MKKIVFSLLMATSMALMAGPNEASMSHNQSPFEDSIRSQEAMSPINGAQHGVAIAAKERSSKGKCNCPAGPQGAPGPQGVPGPVGPRGPYTEGSGVCGSFYSNFSSSAPTVSPAGIIPLSTPTYNEGISLTAGSLVFTSPGDYFVTYGISSSTSSIFGLALNEAPVSGSSGIALPGSNGDNPSTLPQMTTLSTTVRVHHAGSTLSLINMGDSNLSPSSATSGDLVAFLTIHKISHHHHH